MRGLQADAGTRRQIQSDGHMYVPALRAEEIGERTRDGPRLILAQDLIGSSEPIPFGVFIVVQVPFATYFQALPW